MLPWARTLSSQSLAEVSPLLTSVCAVAPGPGQELVHTRITGWAEFSHDGLQAIEESFKNCSLRAGVKKSALAPNSGLSRQR